MMKLLSPKDMEKINPWEYTAKEEDAIRYVSIGIVQHCNLQCIFCSARWANSGFLSFKKFRDYIDAISEYGLRKVELTGGEPLLHPKISEMISYLVKKDIEPIIITNGTMINERIINTFLDNDVKVAVSLHTLKHRTFEKLVIQDKKILDIILRNINILREQLPKLWIRITPFRQNYPDIFDLIDWALDKGVVPLFNIPIPYKIKRGNENLRYMIKPKEYRRLLSYLGEKTGINHVIPFAYNVPCNRFNVGFHINMEGYVFPCASIPLIAGNILTNSVEDIWENSVLVHYRSINNNLRGKCKYCQYNILCYGCRASAFRRYGDIFSEEPMCWR